MPKIFGLCISRVFYPNIPVLGGKRGQAASALFYLNTSALFWLYPNKAVFGSLAGCLRHGQASAQGRLLRNVWY